MIDVPASSRDRFRYGVAAERTEPLFARAAIDHRDA
jgi:hypothetical protein